MHFLERELEINEDLSSAVDMVSKRSAENSIKQGLILDLNPVWLMTFRIEDSGLDPFLFRRGPWFEFGLPWFQGLTRFDAGRLPKLDRNFPDVDEFLHRYHRRDVPSRLQPFLLRLIAKPDLPQSSEDQAKEASYDEERYQLIQIARESKVLTIVETHSPPALLAAPGSRVQSSSGSKGTLGGYVKDAKTNSIYGMTCGHVLTSTALNSKGNRIGNAMHSKLPTPLPTKVTCTHNCGHVTDVDVALISIATPGRNVATSVASIVGNGQLVTMRGATTRRTQTYEVGGHVVEYEIGGSCWEKLIQFHAPTKGVTPASFNIATTPLPQAGDSGAWLLRNSSEWAGMVVASNSLCGFALASTTLLQASDNAFGTNLSLA